MCRRNVISIGRARDRRAISTSLSIRWLSTICRITCCENSKSPTPGYASSQPCPSRTQQPQNWPAVAESSDVKPRDQTGQNLASTSASASRHSGLGLKFFGLGLDSKFNIMFHFLAYSDHADCRRSLQVIARLSSDIVLFVVPCDDSDNNCSHV